MSAFVVSTDHISNLVHAAINYNRRYSHITFAGEKVTEQNATSVGAQLLAECIASVSYRYPNDPIDQLPGPVPTPSAIDYAWRFSPFAKLDAVSILKAIDCYEYQSCEHDGWDTSEAKTFCERLRRAAIGALPGYEEAAWEIEYPTPEYLAARRAEIAARLSA